MEAVRETVDVRDGAVTIRLSAGFAAQRMEVIVLPAAEGDRAEPPRWRRPAPELADTVVRDDLLVTLDDTVRRHPEPQDLQA